MNGEDIIRMAREAGHTFYDGNGNVVAHLDATSEITMDYTKPSAWKYKETGRNGIYTPAPATELREQQEPDYNICPTCGGMASDPIVPPSDRLTSKPWVGLTDDEIALICAECSLRTPCDIYYARAIEAKLREKNEHREKNA